MKEKIKISFDPTEIWNHEDFRQLIKGVKEKTYCDFEYELWIITTNQSLPYINALAEQLEIPNERVKMCLNDSTKVGIITLNTDIHFDGEQSIISTLRPNTSVETVGILVDRKIDYMGIGYKYIKDLDTWTIAIIREGGDACEKTKPC